MIILKDKILDISETQNFTLSFCKGLHVGDVLMLKGELGVGKTTFSRFIINNLHILKNISKPQSISSPTYPILLTYDLKNYEVYHYDLYRINNVKELEEIDFFENIKNSITLIEWPELLINLPLKENHYLINFKLYSETKRIINIEYFKK